MAKEKYYYIVVNKENDKMLLSSSRLPIFWNKKIAQKVADEFSAKITYVVRKIVAWELESLI